MRLPAAARAWMTNRVPVYAPGDVTTRNPAEVDGRDVGLDRDVVPAIWRAVEELYTFGLHPSIAIAIRVRGALVLDRTIGHQRGNGPHEPPSTEPVLATPDTLYNMFSASKSVLAMLIHQADDDGLLHVDDPIAEFIPEFGSQGKEQITIRHLLTHRAGIPTIPGERPDLDLLTSPERILALLCDAPLSGPPGRRLAYHALTGGFLLAEVLRRVTGADVREHVERRIRAPLGLGTFGYGVPEERLGEVAIESFTGPIPRAPFKQRLEHGLGISIQEAVGLSNDPRFRTGIVPAGNLIGTARDICAYFELLRCDGALDGVQVFGRRACRRARVEDSFHELDQIIMLPIRYSSGFMLGGERLSFFGAGTPAAFGHLGFTNVLCWADPERALSVAFLNNGKPFLTPELLVWLGVVREVARRVPRAPRGPIPIGAAG